MLAARLSAPVLFTWLPGRAGAISCSGFGLVDEEWEYIDYLGEIAAANPLAWQGKEFLQQVVKRLESTGVLLHASGTCPGPVFTALAQSVFVFEKEDDEAALQRVVANSRTLSPRVPQAWAPEAQLAWFAWYPLRVDASSCHQGQHPKVYVYETGRFAERPLGCSAGMEGVEVLLHQFFVNSACRELDPSRADFFFVPFYSFCYQNQHLAPGNETAELDVLNKELVASLAFFTEERRHQHIFLFPHEFWDFPSWRSWVSSSILFVVEANPLEYPDGDTKQAPRHCLDCLVPSKDIVLPGHNDHWAARQMQEFALPFESRQYLACYHGAFAHSLYDDAVAVPPFNRTAGQVRAALSALQADRRLSIGPHLRPVRRYYERLGQCRFCFVPKGVGFTNGRLMETFWTGCIPVILSDAMVVPFDDWLDWQAFSIKWPMPSNSAEMLSLVDYLEGLPRELGSRMHQALVAHQCWFNYVHDCPGGPGDSCALDCSPFEGVLRMLKQRMHRPRKYWKPW